MSCIRRLRIAATGCFFIVSLVLSTPVLAGGGGDKAKPEAGPYYNEMPPIKLSVIQDGMVIDQRSMVVVLEVKNFEDIDRIKQQQPILQNAFVNYFHSIASRATREKLNNDAFIKSKIKQLVNKHLGEKVVLDVLFKANQTKVWS